MVNAVKKGSAEQKKTRKAETINREELIDRVCERMKNNHRLVSKSDVRFCMNSMIGEVLDAAERGVSVSLTGFGVFYRHETPARIGRNPKTKQEVKIAERGVLKFRASSKHRDLPKTKVKK